MVKKQVYLLFFSFVTSHISLCFLLFLIVLPDVWLFKCLYFSFSNSLFELVLYLVVKLVHCCNHSNCLNFITLCSFFRSNPCFKACCNNLIWHVHNWKCNYGEGVEFSKFSQKGWGSEFPIKMEGLIISRVFKQRGDITNTN